MVHVDDLAIRTRISIVLQLRNDPSKYVIYSTGSWWIAMTHGALARDLDERPTT